MPVSSPVLHRPAQTIITAPQFTSTRRKADLLILINLLYNSHVRCSDLNFLVVINIKTLRQGRIFILLSCKGFCT